MDAQYEAPHSRHVVDVRKADQADCSEVMDEHDQEVLKNKEKRKVRALYMLYECSPVICICVTTTSTLNGLNYI